MSGNLPQCVIMVPLNTIVGLRAKRQHSRDYRLVSIFCCVWLSVATSVLSQVSVVNPPGKDSVAASRASDQASAIPSALEESTQAILGRQQKIQEDTEKTAEVKEPLLKLYQQALLDLKTASEAQKQKTQWTARIAAAPKSLDEAKTKLSQAISRTTLSDSLDFMSFDDVQKELQELQAKLTAATETRSKLSEQANAREKRRKELPQLVSDTRAKLDAVNANPTAAPAVDDPLTKEAIAWAVQASRAAMSEQLLALEMEQRAYETEAELLLLQLELAQSSEKQLQEPVRKVTEELNRMRQDRILQLRNDVRALVTEMPERMQPTSEDLLQRITDWLALAKKKAAIKAELNDSRSAFERWKERFTKMENRVDPSDGKEIVAGFNSWVGLMLRKQRGELPDPVRLRSQLRSYQQEMHTAESKLFELEDALLDTSIRLESIRNSQATEASADLSAERMLLEKSKEVLSAIQVDVDSYLNELYQVADMKEQTRGLSLKYRSFIDEHVLWIRSCDQLERSDWIALVEAFRWLVSYENWQMLLMDLTADVASKPWWYALFGIFWLLLLVNQARLRRTLSYLSEQASKKNCTAIHFTAEAAFATLFISLPLPSLLLFLYLRMENLNNVDGSFTSAFGKGLLVATFIFFPLEVLRQVSRLGGLGMKHFDWSEAGAKQLRTHLRWLIDFSIPLSIIVATFSAYNNPRWEASLGRSAFILLMLVLAAFFARVFVPKTGILARYLIAYPNGWFERLRYGWYSALVLIPLTLATLSFIGYNYTAQRLAVHVTTTLWVIIFLALAFFFLRRWLLLSRKKLMLAQAKQRLIEAAKRDPNQAPVVQVTEDSEINLVIINEQTMRLLGSLIILSGLVAVFMIWSDVLPAIALLENFELWSVRGDKPDETIKITFANILLVIPILSLMVIAGRNVPGLLEIALLQHLPITNAARYAITTLSRYTMIIVGIMFLFNTIGLRWASIQWLVAALGVGLGFGLQEIFANFVSGLILLFEQPIRVGDVITLDGTTGSVSKIRMRATTIVNFDRQELIIPNKDLITGKLLNWTLSDTTNRIVINVGIAYGSDTDLACATIRKIVGEHPNVLPDPPPVVSFDSFGDSTLNLKLQVFLANLEVRLQTLHELNTRIHRAFYEAGIEISFPQRDLHIRSVPSAIGKWFEQLKAKA